MNFKIEEEEATKIVAWTLAHECSVRGKYQGAIGGALTYCFTNTSIGQIQTVKCACGSEYEVDTHL